jgi:hypothetical protein
MRERGKKKEAYKIFWHKRGMCMVEMRRLTMGRRRALEN